MNIQSNQPSYGPYRNVFSTINNINNKNSLFSTELSSKTVSSQKQTDTTVSSQNNWGELINGFNSGPVSKNSAFWDKFLADFSDEKLAGLISPSDEEQISTEKTINWQANGTKELSEEQIEYLKANYDVENLSGQDYYNLMSDLSQMNVISARDIVKQHVSAYSEGVTSISYLGDFKGKQEIGTVENALFQGNVYQNVQNRFHSLSDTLDMINLGNPFTSASDLLSFREVTETQKDVFERLFEIFNKIKRN